MTAATASRTGRAEPGGVPSAGFRADIQGLRAVAVVLVLLDHAGVPGWSGGYVGVDVFFVISGFLITGQLTRSLRDHGRIHLARFAARRAQRILPASLVVAALTAAAAVVWVAPVRLPGVLLQGLAAVLFVPNVLFAAQGTDYLAEAVPSPFRQYWSLGVEEQFYLLWPVVILLLFVLGRRTMRWVGPGLAVLVAASLLACVVETQGAQPLAFFLLPFRAWELGVGGLLAVAPLHRLPRGARVALGWAGLVLIVVTATHPGDGAAYPGALAALPVLGSVAVLAGQDARGGAGALLGRRPLQLLGAISYSLYLVHWPLLMIPNEAIQWQHPLEQPVPVGLALLAVAVAWLLHRLVERPGRAVRATTRQALAASTALVAIAAVAVLGAQRWATAPVAQPSRAAPATALTIDPAGTDFVPKNLHPSLAAGFAETGRLARLGCQQGRSGSAVLRCDFGDAGATRTVALFGDSHAGRLFPAVRAAADRGGLHLETFVRSSCRSIDDDAHFSALHDRSCAAWRVDAVRRLRADPPDLIVLANHTSSQRALGDQRYWEGVVEQSIRRLPATSRVVLVEDTPQLPSSPLYCLSAHTDAAHACGVARADAFEPHSAAAFRAVAARGDAGLLDLDPYFCNRTWCPAIIGTTLVYSDDHHLTDEFSSRLAGPVLSALQRELAGPARPQAGQSARPAGRGSSSSALRSATAPR